MTADHAIIMLALLGGFGVCGVLAWRKNPIYAVLLAALILYSLKVHTP